VVKSKSKTSTSRTAMPELASLEVNFSGGLSIVLLGLLLSLPFLIPVHRMPIPSFYSEWIAVFLGMLAAVAILTSSLVKLNSVQIPYVVMLPLATFCVVLLQASLGYFSYLSNAFLILMLLLWSAVLMTTVSNCLRLLSLECLTKKLALFIVAGGVINAVFGLLQFFHIAPYLPELISAPMSVSSSGVYGNLAQQNHFATHLSLALAALFYLYLSRYVRGWQASLLAAVLLAGLFLSGSRSVFLYLLCGVIFAMVGRERVSHPSFKRLLRLVGLVLLMMLGAGALFASFGYELPQLQRYLYLSEAIGARAFLWRNAWTMFLNAPILGVGWDAFAFQLIEQIGQRGQANAWGVDQYAHNLLLQLLAVSGLLGLFAFLLPAGFFLRRQGQQKLNNERRFFYTSLSILLIHSMLEQPLYYAYFLAFASCMLACLETKFFSLKLSKLSARLCALGLVFVLLLGVKTLRDFWFIETNFYGDNAQTRQVPAQELRALHAWSVFPSTIESLRPDIFVSHQASAAEKLNLNQRLMHFSPVAETGFRHAALLAEDGKIDDAKLRFRTTALAYPEQVNMYLQRFKILGQREPGKYAALAAYAETISVNLAVSSRGTGSR
jgi:O-antigen ligase